MHRTVMGRVGRRARAHLGQNTHCAPTLGRRSFTTTGPVASQAARASEAVEQLTHKFQGKTSVRRQIFDANQLQKLSLTLGRRELDGVDVSDTPPLAGTPVPPGWHLVYFTPNGVESELGPDGTDRTFNSPEPFTRRMWAGGRMTWPAAGDEATALRVGDEVEERTRFVGATAKANKLGQEMVLVEIEKEFWGPRGLGVVDQRSWIFRTEAQASSGSIKRLTDADTLGPSIARDEMVDGLPQRHMRWSPVGLFRFSALTFNGHKIHYNQTWTGEVEGHPGEVVHGPLNLIGMLDYWRDHHGKETTPRVISYRALSPIYAGESYVIKTGDIQEIGGGTSYEVLVEKKGVISMRGEILT
ncbi:hypothetical protein F5X68DRAFT_240547 [Plectosphaerella plurivora]|uniref:Uncharacterized protein n=1 Tax=Plectosphaerella plurivora TaxID=936078 RepID=A0A9P8V9W0_9PEZI|nr:hypothetical protein F5X68DRAFT_240547 [Plectosphaerella plurivora]